MGHSILDVARPPPTTGGGSQVSAREPTPPNGSGKRVDRHVLSMSSRLNMKNIHLSRHLGPRASFEGE
jgi:hypothetical protein